VSVRTHLVGLAQLLLAFGTEFPVLQHLIQARYCQRLLQSLLNNAVLTAAATAAWA